MFIESNIQSWTYEFWLYSWKWVCLLSEFVLFILYFEHCALVSIRIWDKIVLLVIKSNIQSWILEFWICSRKLVGLLSKLVYSLSFILKHCALASIRMWDMALSHSSSLVWGWPLSVVVRLLDLFFWNWKLDAPLNYDYDIIGTLMNDYTAKMSLGPDDWTAEIIWELMF